MKRILALLLAALLLAAPALAEGYTWELPEGFSWVEGEEMAAYLAAAEADADANFPQGARLALNGTASLSAVLLQTDQPDAEAAAREILRGYAEYIPGFENVEPEKAAVGEAEFWRFSFAIDGETATQYCAVNEGEMILITLIGVGEEALSGFLWNEN